MSAPQTDAAFRQAAACPPGTLSPQEQFQCTWPGMLYKAAEQPGKAVIGLGVLAALCSNPVGLAMLAGGAAELLALRHYGQKAERQFISALKP